MYILVLSLPFFSTFISGFAGRFLGSKGSGIITSLLITITWVIALFIFFEVGLNNSTCYLELFKWIDTGIIDINFGLMFDSITSTMLIVVLSVSMLVHIYSTGYMESDPHLPRFMSYLSLFTWFMIILVTADNYLQLFIGWEGVGLCSYLLINFWFTRIQANKSAIKAMIVNRIGDLGLILGIFTIAYSFGSLDFTTVFALTDYFDNNYLYGGVHTVTLIGILLFIGAVGKSAQLGLHTWLPDAMEGPTPVSALIHAATMVTAGVFLLIRSSFILEHSEITLSIIVIVGSITALFAATVGLVQNDIKKVIAYSTCSQLGYMVFSCGISNYSASLFHLMNHAFFKALLFLSAGAVIHALGDEQDMRKMGGLIKTLPFTYSLMLIASLSLAGFPFLTGFYSKDAILELTFAHYTISANFAYWLGTVSALFTSFYSFRLLFQTFINNPHSSLINFKFSTESPINMSLPLFILAIGSIFVGYLGKDIFIGPGSTFFTHSIYVLPNHITLINAEFLSPIIKQIPVIGSIIGAVTAIIIYSKSRIFNIREIYIFLSNKWHFDYIYNNYIVKPIFTWGHNVSYKVLDKGLIEVIGPNGLSSSIRYVSTIFSRLQSGQVYNYAFTIIIFTALYLQTLTLDQHINVEYLIIIPILLFILS